MIQTIQRFLVRSMLFVLLFGVVFMTCWLLANPARAQARSAFKGAFPVASAGHATVIVLDMSGSMGQNDPLGLRCSAADAYIDLSGVTDYIGVVGLDNNNGQRTGTHNFQTAQLWTPQLVNTATLADKQNLKNTITNTSNSCRPDNTTPTYDSLSKAYTLLDSITKQHHISGSVILLTDGTPDPDTDAQIAAIKSDLVPQFQQRNWPIDTIGLGQDAAVGGTTPGTFHDFLRSISNATGGKFYDDGHGPVAGVSPLNIAPFFVDIFARYSGDTVNHDIPVTQLDGGTTQRNFAVTDGANQLDVVVVKDLAGTTASLIDPNGQTVVADNVGVFVSKDAYHVIYQITQPQAGQWTVSVSGAGSFLMDSLHTTDIGLSFAGIGLKNSTLSDKTVLPLGQPLTVSAYLTQNGQPLTDNTFSVNGTIDYAGGSGIFSQPFTLNDSAVPGTYVGNVTVPDSAPAGSYNIQLKASTVSVQNVVSSLNRAVRLEIFPFPYLLAQNKQPTDTTVSTTVVQWWLPFQWLYSIPGIDHLSGWPLQGFPADPHTNLSGELQWQGKLYQGANVTATAYDGKAKAYPVTVVQDGQGNFVAQFVPPVSGLYSIVFQTSGTYKDSQGAFGPTTRQVQVTVQPPTLGQIGFATGITALYLVILLFLIFFVRFWFLPRPYGMWVYNPGSESPSSRQFSRAHRGLLQWFFTRNRIKSRQAGMPTGLVFRFGYGKNIEVRPDKSARSKEWLSTGSNQLRPSFQRVRELVHRPRGADDMDSEQTARYVIETDAQGRRRNDSDRYDGYSAERRRPTRSSGRGSGRGSRQPEYSSSRNRGKRSSSEDYYGEY